MAPNTSPSKGKGRQADHTQQAPSLPQLPHGLSVELPPSGFAVLSPYFSKSTTDPQVAAGPLLDVGSTIFTGPSVFVDHGNTNHPDTQLEAPEATTTKEESLDTPVVRLIAGIRLGVTPFPDYAKPTLQECYNAVAAVANRWLDLLDTEVSSPHLPVHFLR